MTQLPIPELTLPNILDTVPPHNFDAERSVLGACIIEPEAIDACAGILGPSDFYKEAHGITFSTIQHLRATGTPVDYISLSNELRDSNRLEFVGGGTFLTELIESVPTSANVEVYADIVRRKAVRRRVVELSRTLMRVAVTCEDEDLQDRTNDIVQRILDLQFASNDTAAVHIAEECASLIADLEKGPLNKKKGSIVRSGFRDLDEVLWFQTTDLVLISARPGIGKSQFASQVASNIAQNHGPVVQFSLELPTREITLRLVGAESRISGTTLKEGKDLTDWEWQEVVARVIPAINRVANRRLYIYNRPVSVPEMRAICLKVMRLERCNLAAVVLDRVEYLKEVRNGKEDTFNRSANAMTECKSLAVDLNTVGIVVTQLNRDVERRDDKRPRKSDIRNSGEEQAQVILMPFRPGYYEKDQNPYDAEMNQAAHIYIEKNTNGPEGMVELRWEPTLPALFDK